MAVKTSNAYGVITIDDEAIACATGHIARDCYGVVDLVGQGSVKSKNQLTKGIKIITNPDINAAIFANGEISFFSCHLPTNRLDAPYNRSLNP